MAHKKNEYKRYLDGLNQEELVLEYSNLQLKLCKARGFIKRGQNPYPSNKYDNKGEFVCSVSFVKWQIVQCKLRIKTEKEV